MKISRLQDLRLSEMLAHANLQSFHKEGQEDRPETLQICKTGDNLRR